MDLGIAGKWALVCGASKGLGLGCAQALHAEGVNVVLVARGLEVLQQAAIDLIAVQAIKIWSRGIFHGVFLGILQKLVYVNAPNRYYIGMRIA
jgi:3-oxoacyl-[acyl-carrier protein] reductase